MSIKADLMKLPIDVRVMMPAAHLHIIEDWANAEIQLALRTFENRLVENERVAALNHERMNEIDRRMIALTKQKEERV